MGQNAAYIVKLMNVVTVNHVCMLLSISVSGMFNLLGVWRAAVTACFCAHFDVYVVNTLYVACILHRFLILSIFYATRMSDWVVRRVCFAYDWFWFRHQKCELWDSKMRNSLDLRCGSPSVSTNRCLFRISCSTQKLGSTAAKYLCVSFINATSAEGSALAPVMCSQLLYRSLS